MPLIPLFVQNELQAAAANRLSAFNFCDPFDHVLPFSDASIGALDRQHLWGLYAGIAAGAPVAAVVVPTLVGNNFGPPGFLFGRQATMSGTVALSSSRIYAIPWACSQRQRFDQVVVNVSNADAGSALRVAIYEASRVTMLPQRRIGQADEIASTSTGNLTATIRYIARPEWPWNWLVIGCDSSAVILSGLLAADMRALGHVDAYTNSWTYLRFAHTYVAGKDLPESLSTVDVESAQVGDAPYAALRWATL